MRTRRRTGLSLTVQQSRGSLRSQWGPSTRYVVARGTLPPSAAEPQLPSEATRVPPSIDLNILAYLASDGASASGAAEPQLPSVAVWALRLPIELRCVLGSGRGPSPPVQQSCRLPSVVAGALVRRIKTFLVSRLQEGLVLPVQQSRSSLQKQRELLI
ncbi:hypothetical protein ROHU_028926 [Labeo rohita]|uniref:Uncharacterized protein n=1 Tax=Labeo rohita TaxID=84645 RepID=A0A498LZ45_LABRO|nr:hypothetical protein ROHU_028926 [Labeo rohita]